MNIKQKIKTLIKSPHKILLSATFSVVITFLFAIYNLHLGLRYGDSWGKSISIYYLCLIVARIISLITERKIKDSSEDKKDVERRKTYIGLSIFIFFIDLCLIAPITIMVVKPKDVNFGIIPAIAVATYTTYKTTMAIININKIKKVENLIYKFLRELSLIDAMISVLTLQHTLIMVNGGMTDSMQILSACSSFGILLVIIAFSICVMVKNLKNKQKLTKHK
ncbi:MAG: hypothetical protein ACI4TZ_04090 [Christensenellales bacterium]